MLKRFAENVELTIVTDLNEKDEPVETTELFRKGDEVEFDIFGHPEKFEAGRMVEDLSLWNIQFGDGSCAFGVEPSWFEAG